MPFKVDDIEVSDQELEVIRKHRETGQTVESVARRQAQAMQRQRQLGGEALSMTREQLMASPDHQNAMRAEIIRALGEIGR